MLHGAKDVAPEPYFSAATLLLYYVALEIRMGMMSAEQVVDLADAVHNVPESLIQYGKCFDEQSIRQHYLQAYDEKWVKTEEDFSLIRTLNSAIVRVRVWLQAE